jgi:hypothetical protein
MATPPTGRLSRIRMPSAPIKFVTLKVEGPDGKARRGKVWDVTQP